MTLKHKLKFIIAVLKGDVSKVTEVEKPVIIASKFKETMNLSTYIVERKKYLEKLTEAGEGLEEIDSEYLQLEEAEKLFKKTWPKIKT